MTHKHVIDRTIMDPFGGELIKFQLRNVPMPLLSVTPQDGGDTHPNMTSPGHLPVSGKLPIDQEC
jgi:hypothetical protein